MTTETNNVPVLAQASYLSELQNTHELCQLLMKTPHYAKMGAEGIFAIVETAKSLGIDPRQALGGGLYYVKGKVEMSARLMAGLIRQKKHSITRDSKSDSTICILHGKRSDTHDCWTEGFSMAEALKAGLTKNPVWNNFPRDMLYARALSRLARQLFPDLIGNCYVKGEISEDPNIPEVAEPAQIEAPVKKSERLSEDQHKNLSFFLDQVPEYRDKVMAFLQKKGVSNLWEMPQKTYEVVLEKAQGHVQNQDQTDGGI